MQRPVSTRLLEPAFPGDGAAVASNRTTRRNLTTALKQIQDSRRQLADHAVRRIAAAPSHLLPSLSLLLMSAATIDLHHGASGWPRFMAQPPLHPAEPFNLDREARKLFAVPEIGHSACALQEDRA